MNEIKSEVKGKISEILLENARSVEYGQALFMVEQI
jgi:biotin carboxyl carrier protein